MIPNEVVRFILFIPMEIMSTEELKKELEKLKDFKVYVFEWDVYVKAEDYGEKAIENKNLKAKCDMIELRLSQFKRDNKKLEEENRKLKKENKRLMSDLITTIEERDNNIKRVEELKEKIRFLEQCLDNKEKVNKSLREELEKLKVKYWDLDY